MCRWSGIANSMEAKYPQLPDSYNMIAFIFDYSTTMLPDCVERILKQMAGFLVNKEKKNDIIAGKNCCCTQYQYSSFCSAGFAYRRTSLNRVDIIRSCH